LIVEVLGSDGRHHSDEDEEFQVNVYDFGGHPDPSFFLVDALVDLASLEKLKASAFVT
jgi:hypothetical protein